MNYINVNGITRAMTPEEQARYEEEQRQIAAEAERAEMEYAKSRQGKAEFQAFYTAVMTDTLIE